MVITDPIADMLTRIRNAYTAKHDEVSVPASTIKKAIAEILLDEGYIKGYEIKEEGPKKTINIALKYGPNRQRVITGLKRISKPGLRVYARKDNVPKVLNGMGIAYPFHQPRRDDRPRSPQAGRRRRSPLLYLVITKPIPFRNQPCGRI